MLDICDGAHTMQESLKFVQSSESKYYIYQKTENLTDESTTHTDLSEFECVVKSFHVQKLWTSMHNSAYDCDKKNPIAPLNSLGTLEIYHVIKTAN